jgi:hypothetical protein
MNMKRVVFVTALMAILALHVCIGMRVSNAEEALGESWTGKFYDGQVITKEMMDERQKNHRLWLETKKEKGSRITFYKVQLRGLGFWKENLRGANFYYCDLGDVDFGSNDHRFVDFTGSDLSNAAFNSYLPETGGQGSDLRGAIFTKARLKGADFYGVNLDGVVFEPEPDQLPNIASMVTAKNLTGMTYKLSPRGLVELREAFKKAGMRLQERELSFAIKHSERIKGKNPVWRRVQYALFEFPVGWGLYPERALFIMAGTIPFFAVLYYFPLGLGTWRGGTIWMRWRKKRATNLSESDHPRPLKRRGWRRAVFALYFSLLSAFHIGWRDLNVGTWITRMQPREYTLQATGWVRVISGVQSLISVYLLALAVLSYFGRPFE